MESRGGVSGGLTISDALVEFESLGYTGQFVIRATGIVECTGCGVHHEPQAIPLEKMRRIEGASDPADMVLVGALTCPRCGLSGTTVVAFGPTAPVEDGDFLRHITDRRHSSDLNHEVDDASTIRDSGWLVGPDG